jgi:glycosyltransferase involved in cell wall biosynthesis
MAAQPGTKILMVSAFRPQKDQLSLVRAMQYLPESYSLFLAGGAKLPKHRLLMEQCRDTAASLGIENRVAFLGIRRDVPELMAAADIIVLSTHHEGKPISLIEAMASGRPVLASDVAGVREFAPSREALFPEGDSQLIADKIAFLAKNPDISRLIGKRGIDTARKYDIALTADAYRQLYAYLLKD